MAKTSKGRALQQSSKSKAKVKTKLQSKPKQKQKPKQLSFGDSFAEKSSHVKDKPKPKAKIKAVLKPKIVAKPKVVKSELTDKEANAKTVKTSDKTSDKVINKTAEKATEKVTPKASRIRVNAERLGEMQREISISEFFTKNRHLLGFDNTSRALLTSVKEAVDNSLDACEEAGILPEIHVRIEEVSPSRFRICVEDNGPGIIKAQVSKVFGKLLYGSKFHRLRQSRGQQGIGISAAGMYGQLTTGKPVHVITKTGKGRTAYACDLSIDARQNKPIVFHESEDTSPHWLEKNHGTSVAIEMEATYKGGRRSLDEWVQQVAFANPHARVEYLPPGKPPIVYPCVTPELPPETKEIKPHPHGVELGLLLRMKQGSAARTLASFLQQEFSRVSSTVAAEICRGANLRPEISLKSLTQAQMEAVYTSIAATKIMAPPTNCLAPIGEVALLEGLKALLVQQQLSAADATSKRRSSLATEENALPGMSDIAEAESKVTTALAEQVSQLAAEGEEDDELDSQEANKAKSLKDKNAATAKIKTKNSEANQQNAEADANATKARAGIVKIFDKPYFITAVTRGPKVYRGNPFQVEAAVAFGGDLPGDELASVYRFANRVPLLYQQGACAMTQSVVRTNWKSYDVDQSRGALPSGPLLIMVHIASVWVPFTSEAKEAVAHYDEIIGELKFALQECGRRLSRHIRRRRRIIDQEKKAKYIEKYIPHIGQALQDILGLSESRRDVAVDKLTQILERSRKIG